MVHALLFLSQSIVFNGVPLFSVIFVINNIYKYKISISIIVLYMFGRYFHTLIYFNIAILSLLMGLMLVVVILIVVDWLIIAGIVLPIIIYFLLSVSVCVKMYK